MNGAFIALLASLYFARRYLELGGPVDAASLLCALHRLGQRAHLSSGMVAILAITTSVMDCNCCRRLRYSRRWDANFSPDFSASRYVVAAAALVIAASYYSVWHATPICLREAQVNGKDRMALDRQLAETLKTFPPSATFMMNCGAHPGATQMAGVPLRRVLCESSNRLWKAALKQPARSADYIIAFPRRRSGPRGA